MEIEIVERKSGKKNEKRKRNSVRKKCGSGKKKYLRKLRGNLEILEIESRARLSDQRSTSKVPPLPCFEVVPQEDSRDINKFLAFELWPLWDILEKVA